MSREMTHCPGKIGHNIMSRDLICQGWEVGIACSSFGKNSKLVLVVKLFCKCHLGMLEKSKDHCHKA